MQRTYPKRFVYSTMAAKVFCKAQSCMQEIFSSFKGLTENQNGVQMNSIITLGKIIPKLKSTFIWTIHCTNSSNIQSSNSFRFSTN